MKNSISIEEARLLRAALDDYLSGRTDGSACAGIIGAIAGQTADDARLQRPAGTCRPQMQETASAMPPETIRDQSDSRPQTDMGSDLTSETSSSVPAGRETSETPAQFQASREIRASDQDRIASLAGADEDAAADDVSRKSGETPRPGQSDAPRLSAGPRLADFGAVDLKEAPSQQERENAPGRTDERLTAASGTASAQSAENRGEAAAGALPDSAGTAGSKEREQTGASGGDDVLRRPAAAGRRPQPPLREPRRQTEPQTGPSFEMFTGRMLSGVFAAVLLVIGFIFTARAINFSFGPMSRFAGMEILSIGMILWGLGGRRESGNDRSRAIVCGIGFSLLYVTTACACFVFDLISPRLWAPATLLWSLAAAVCAARRHSFMFLLAQLGVIISMPLGASTGDLTPFGALLMAFSAQLPVGFMALRRGDIRLGICTMSGVFMLLAQYLDMSRFHGIDTAHMHIASLMGAAALLIAMFSAGKPAEGKPESGRVLILFRFSAFLCAVISIEFLRLASGCRGIVSAVMPERGILLTEMAKAELLSKPTMSVPADTSRLKLLPTLLAGGFYAAVTVWAETTRKSFSAGAGLLKQPLLAALLAMGALPLAFFLVPIAANGLEHQHFPLLLPLIVLVHVAISVLRGDENSRKLAGILTLLLTAPAAAAPLACGHPSVSIVLLAAMIALSASMMISKSLQESLKAGADLTKALLLGFALLLTYLAWVQSSADGVTGVTEALCAVVAAAIYLVAVCRDLFSADAARASLPLAVLWTATLSVASAIGAGAIGGDWGNLFYAFTAFALLEMTRRLPAFRADTSGAKNGIAEYLLLTPCLAGMYALFLHTVPLLSLSPSEILPRPLLRLLGDAGDPAEVQLPVVIASSLLLAMFFFSKSLRDFRAGMNSSRLAYLCFSLLTTLPAIIAALDGCNTATFLQGNAMLIFSLPGILLCAGPAEYNSDDEKTRCSVIRLVMLWALGLWLPYVLLSRLISPLYLPFAAGIAICLLLAVTGRSSSFAPLAGRRLLHGLPGALAVASLFALTAGWDRSAAAQAATLPEFLPSWLTYGASCLILAAGLFLGLTPGRGERGDRARTAGLCSAALLSALMICAFGFDTTELKIQAAAVAAAALPCIWLGSRRKSEEDCALYAATSRLTALWGVSLFALYCITLHLITPLALMLSVMAASVALCLRSAGSLRDLPGGAGRIPLFCLPAVALVSLIYLLTADYSSLAAVQRAMIGDLLPAGLLWLTSTALFALPYFAGFRLRTVHPLRGVSLATNCLRGLIPALAITMTFFEDAALTASGFAILSAALLLLATYLVRQNDIESRPAVHRGVETAVLWAGALYVAFGLAGYLADPLYAPLIMTAVAGVAMYLTRDLLSAGLRKEAVQDASRLYLLFRLPAMALAACFYLACGGYDATVAIGRSALPALPDCFTWVLCTLVMLGVIYCNLRRDIRDGFDRIRLTAYTLGTCCVILMIAMKFFESRLVTLSLLYPLAAVVCHMGRRHQSRTLSLSALLMFALATLGIYLLHYSDFATPVQVLYSTFVYLTIVAALVLNRSGLGQFCYSLASYALLAVFLGVFAGFDTATMLLIPALIHATAAHLAGDRTQFTASACGFAALALLLTATACPLAPALLPVAGCLIPAAFGAVSGSGLLSKLGSMLAPDTGSGREQKDWEMRRDVPCMPEFVIALGAAIAAGLALASGHGQIPEEMLQNVYEETAPQAAQIMAMVISGAFGIRMLLKAGNHAGAGVLRFGGLYLILSALGAVTFIATGFGFDSHGAEALTAVTGLHHSGKLEMIGALLVAVMAGIVASFVLRTAKGAGSDPVLQARPDAASCDRGISVLCAYVSAAGFAAGTLRILLNALPGISLSSLLLFAGLAAFALMTTPLLLANPECGGFRRGYVCAKLYTLLALFMLGMLEVSQTVFSLSGIALALLILVWGFLSHDSRFRIAGLTAASIFVVKLVLTDISYNSDLTKALSYVGSGLLLLAISLMYNRLKSRDKNR